MRKVFAIALLCLTSAAAFAAPSSSLYDCEGLGGVDEYRVGIDLNSGELVFLTTTALLI